MLRILLGKLVYFVGYLIFDVKKEWSNRAGSNCRPPRCQRGALPPELRFDGYHFGRGVNYTD